jgi:hypothetical protein
MVSAQKRRIASTAMGASAGVYLAQTRTAARTNRRVSLSIRDEVNE